MDNATKNDPKIEDAEIVKDVDITKNDTNNESVDSNNEVDALASVERLINLHISKIELLKKEIKPVKEMIESLLQSDLTYAELSEAATKANKDKTARKREIINTKNGKELSEKLKGMQEEIRDAQDAISTYLTEYQRQTGLNEFEGEDGELRQIVMVAKLVRKTNLNRD